MKNQVTVGEYTFDFPWGVVVRVYDVGPYAVVEYYRNRMKDVREFHPYVYGSDTNQVFPSLEGALLGAMAFNYIGRNTDFAFLVARMLGLPERTA